MIHERSLQIEGGREGARHLGRAKGSEGKKGGGRRKGGIDREGRKVRTEQPVREEGGRKC